jgi:predicted nuclease of predicted toxin-antitoxin system
MARLVTDIDFNHYIMRGLKNRRPEIDLVVGQDVGLDETSDFDVLAWAAREDRIVLSHDRRTMTAAVKTRLRLELPVLGAIIVSRRCDVNQAVEEILIGVECSRPEEWTDRTLMIPIR